MKGSCCEFHDFVGADDLYRKYRVFLIGGEILPEHCVAHRHWNVHSASRLDAMLDSTELQREEMAFLEDWRSPLSHSQQQALEEVAARIDLDYCGVDFSTLPGGELIVFEANPMMRINDDFNDRFPYLSRATGTIKDACRRLLKSKLRAWGSAPGTR